MFVEMLSLLDGEVIVHVCPVDDVSSCSQMTQETLPYSFKNAYRFTKLALLH